MTMPSFKGRALGTFTAAGLTLLLAQGCTPGPSSSEGNAPGTGGQSGGKTGGSSGGSSGQNSGGSGNGGSANGSGGSNSSSGGSGAPGSGGAPGTGGDTASGGSSGDNGGLGGSGGSGGGDAATGTPPDTTSSTPPAGLGPWTGKDDVPPSVNPPGGLKPEQVPMFISMGFDDNPYADGVNWVVSEFSKLKNPAGSGQAATYDGTPVRATFYDSSTYAPAAPSWKAAYNAGFEVGNHTVQHGDGAAYTEAMWSSEIKGCIDFHTGPAVGEKREDIVGFRTPFLHYNVNTFPAVQKANFWYDCSIEEGHQPDQDGTNYWWPYTLDNGSPGNATHPKLTPIKSWPKGLWEMPAYRVIAPPDADCTKYGVPVGLRAKLMGVHPDGVGIAQGKITGLDYNLWSDYGVSKPEFVAMLKYSLDQHRKGNRAPMLMGMHTFFYSTVDDQPSPHATLSERKAAVVEFLTWALATYSDVRIVTTKAVLDWIRNPVALK